MQGVYKGIKENIKMKYKKIIGGNQEEAEKKFSWLKEADFEDAIIDITGDFLVWEDGYWEDGYWEDGIWEDGIWEDGIWEDGIWEDGIWEDGYWKDGYWKDGTWENGTWISGKMWNTLLNKYQRVRYNKEKNIFEVVEEK